MPELLFFPLAFQKLDILQRLFELGVRQAVRFGEQPFLLFRRFWRMAGVVALTGEISGGSSEKSCNDSYIFGFGLRLSGFPIAENATVLSELVCKKGFFYTL